MSPATSSHNKGNNEKNKRNKNTKCQQQNERTKKRDFSVFTSALRSVQYYKYNFFEAERHSNMLQQYKK